MQGWVIVLPLFTAALAATVPPTPKDYWSRQDVVEFYNRGTHSDYLYRPVESGASKDQARPGQIHFMVKETECLKSETKNIEDCKFKEGGAMKACTVFLPEDPKTDEIMINCDSRVSKRTRLARNVYWCRRVGCFSSIAFGVPEPSVSDKEDLEGIRGVFGPDSLREDNLPGITSNFRPAEGISFNDDDQNQDKTQST